MSSPASSLIAAINRRLARMSEDRQFLEALRAGLEDQLQQDGFSNAAVALEIKELPKATQGSFILKLPFGTDGSAGGDVQAVIYVRLPVDRRAGPSVQIALVDGLAGPGGPFNKTVPRQLEQATPEILRMFYRAAVEVIDSEEGISHG